MALTHNISKYFESLVGRHIKILFPTQFVYHPAPTHQEKKDIQYIRKLLVGFTLAFNTIIPQKLNTKLYLLGFNTASATGSWTFDREITGSLQQQQQLKNHQIAQ